MNALLEGVRSALEVWPLWLVLLAFAVIAWKMPKRKGKRAMRNPATNAGKDMQALSTGVPQPGASRPFYALHSENRDRF